MSIASRLAALCLLTATPLAATLVNLTFVEYCDQLTGVCGAPDASYQFAVVGTTTVTFDDGIVHEAVLGSIAFINFGTPLIDSSLSATLPLAVPSSNASASVNFQAPLRIFPGAAANLRIEADSSFQSDGENISHQIAIAASGFDLPVDPTDIAGILLSSAVSFTFTESETALVNLGTYWAAITSQYSGVAWLVDVHPVTNGGAVVSDTPESPSYALFAIGCIFLLRRKR